jgi:hypothetical protein
MTKIISIILSLAIVLTVLASCGSAPFGGEQADEDAPLNYRRPMVYAYDEIYYVSDYVKDLPDGVESVGSIEKQLDPSELPDENFVSNTDMAAQGSAVYAGEDTTVIYIEWTGSEKSGYMVFTTDVEEASRRK